MYAMSVILRAFSDPLALVLLLSVLVLWSLRGIRWQRSKRLWWWVLISISCFLYFLSVPPVVSSLSYLLERDFQPPELDELREIETIVVLGGGVLKGDSLSKVEPSAETASRLLFALRMFKRSNANLLIMSGGGNKVSEAEVMARVAKNLGVDESKIIVESSSNNTWEHAVELNRILKDSNATIGIVTSALHMKRSFKVFTRYFPNTVPLPSSYLHSPIRLSVRFFVPSSHGLYKSSIIIHEIIGLILYVVMYY